MIRFRLLAVSDDAQCDMHSIVAQSSPLRLGRYAARAHTECELADMIEASCVRSGADERKDRARRSRQALAPYSNARAANGGSTLSSPCIVIEQAVCGHMGHPDSCFQLEDQDPGDEKH